MTQTNIHKPARVLVSHEKYNVSYDEVHQSLIFKGAMRFQGSEPSYQEIVLFLEKLAEQQPPTVILDLKSLQFLNSLGISLLSKFVINVRKRKTIQLTVLGSQDIPWQNKSLKNFQRLMPSLKLEVQ